MFLVLRFVSHSSETGKNYASPFCDPAKHGFARAIDEPRQAGICAVDAASSVDHLLPLRRTLSGPVQGPVVLVPRSVPMHGVCAVSLSRKLAGHRSVFARAVLQTWLRRKELIDLTLEHIQRREDHWAIVDLVGKRRAHPHGPDA